MKVIQFKPEHAEVAEIVGEDAKLCTPENLKQLYNEFAGTFIVDGRIVAFSGFVPSDDKVGEVWLLPTKYLYENFVAAARSIKRYTRSLPRLYGFKELRTCGHNDKRVIRWLQWLGFERKEDNLYVMEI